VPAKILELIDKVDTFELVRDEIAAILAVELANQQVLAPLALPPEDPRLWQLRVFIERSNPWSEFQDGGHQLDTPPIVNVWFDESSIDLKRSNVVERQMTEGTFNLDVYAYGVSEESGPSHIPGDERAARARDRGVRLVRNILMGGAYTYLGMRGVVARRYFQSIKTFQPQFDDRAAQRVQAVRLALRVEFNEFSPQVQGEPFELLHLTVKRKETGEVFFVAEYEA
jgi:hypothetical protein